MVQLQLDKFDLKIMALLESDGRQRINKIADSVGLSPPACHNRVVKLESFGYIKGYFALLDHKKIGKGVTSVIFLDFKDHSIDLRKNVLSSIANIEEVTEVLHITGEHDLLLRVLVSSVEQLHQLVNEKLSSITGVEKVHTSMVLNVVKPMYEKIKKKRKLAQENMLFK